MRVLIVLGLGLALATSAAAQVRVEVPFSSGRVNVNYTEPADEGQAMRLRDLAARLKPLADQLENLPEIDIVIVHTQRELDLRLGPDRAGALTGVSYVHGILFLTPAAWQRAATEEALEAEMQQALIRYAAVRLAGGTSLPEWLEQGLVSVLTRQPFAPASAEPVTLYGPLLLAQAKSPDTAVGYWAVRYLIEVRGGMPLVRQLLRLAAQRPDSFVENLQLTYGVPVGELERDWRRWLKEIVEEDKRKRERERREGPLEERR